MMIGRKKNFYIHACYVKILHKNFFLAIASLEKNKNLHFSSKEENRKGVPTMAAKKKAAKKKAAPKRKPAKKTAKKKTAAKKRK
jgi:topoisomerase IA-like protein